MSQNHHTQVVAQIQELAATFIQQEANTDPLITITSANASPDLKNATIFFTTIPDSKETDALIFLKRSGRALRQYIKNKSKLKSIPNIEFSIDYGERHRQHVDEVFRDIDTQTEG
jgi:ribosome-binding factor A